MEIKQNDDQNRGRFFVNVDGADLASMTYSKAGPGKIIIDHTEVDESLRGQGVGYQLVEAAVAYARQNKLQIMPLCPFAAAVFKKRSDYQDVLF
jgi:hypothetical protein